jgi:phage tail protein X
MSERADIKDGSEAETGKYGLVYTCLGGWIDIGHASPGPRTQKFWRDVISESGESSSDGQWYKVHYHQEMGKWGMTASSGGDFAVYKGLSHKRKESVALGIFLQVSMQFEQMQADFLFGKSPARASSFSVEDLVSNLISFYRTVRPGIEYVKLLEPVSKAAAEEVWDKYGSVGSHKNKTTMPMLFPCSKCSNGPKTVQSVSLPQALRVIQTDSGQWWRRWEDVQGPRVSIPVSGLPAKSHTVAAGESLSAIALRYYGDSLLWPLIMEKNPSVAGNPNLLHPGMVIQLPDLYGVTEQEKQTAKARGRQWR